MVISQICYKFVSKPINMKTLVKVIKTVELKRRSKDFIQTKLVLSNGQIIMKAKRI